MITMYYNDLTSHPTMGAWIEIYLGISRQAVGAKSHPTMGAWIEINYH